MILLELEPNEKESVETIIKENSLDGEILEKKNFNGQTEILQIIFVLTSASLPIIGKIIIEKIRSKKHIEVKYKGLTIKGLSEENTLKMLKKIIDKK